MRGEWVVWCLGGFWQARFPPSLTRKTFYRDFPFPKKNSEPPGPPWCIPIKYRPLLLGAPMGLFCPVWGSPLLSFNGSSVPCARLKAALLDPRLQDQDSSQAFLLGSNPRPGVTGASGARAQIGLRSFGPLGPECPKGPKGQRAHGPKG